MPIFLENLKNIWSTLEVRVMIMISLLLQTILITFGSRRKSMKSWWIMSLVWLCYLLADNVAILSVGLLLRDSAGYKRGGGSLEGSLSNTTAMSLPMFWSPFLLLHLGGPDTITAYSKQDNELWLRHSLNLVFQVVTVLYGLFNYWITKNVLGILTIPIFVSGLMKYAERIWMMWSVSSNVLIGPKVSKLVLPWQYQYVNLSLLKNVTSDARYLHKAYFYVNGFRRLVLGGRIYQQHLDAIRKMSANEAFESVEVQLSLMFDLLYTKTRIIYSIFGVILRVIVFSSTISALAVFYSILDTHAYSHVDWAITRSLLVGAIALEVYAVLTNIYSDWTLLWLTNQKNSRRESIFRAISSSPLYSLCKKKRWSKSMEQLNLTRYWSSNNGPLKYLGGNKPYGLCFNLRTRRLVTQANVTEELQRRIFRRVKQYNKRSDDFMRMIRSNSLLDQKHRGILRRYKIYDPYNFDLTLIFWHVATHSIYDCPDLKAEDLEACKTSMLLADYIFYLLAMCPFLLLKSSSRSDCLKVVLACEEELPPDVSGVLRWVKKQAPEMMGKARNFSKHLLSLSVTKVEIWEMACEIWVSILIHVAAKCRWEDQAEQLSKGGEFLTHVWLLMAHLDLVEEFW